MIVRIYFSLFFLLWAVSAQAAIELSRQGETPQRINEVYHHEGVPYFAIDDVLPALGMSGYWNSVEHRYRMSTPRGRATFFPGGKYLNFGETFRPIEHPPRFIDGRLRVAESFVLDQLADLLPTPIYYRNLDPAEQIDESSEGVFDRLFAFLLQKKKSSNSPALRAVAIDPAHGGEDMGTIGLSGIKEKDVVLAVAKKLETRIKMQLGVPVYLSRDDDYTLSEQRHLSSARHDEVDAFLLLHAQASLSAAANGVHLYVRPAESELNSEQQLENGSMRLALSLTTALRDAGFAVAEVAQAPLVSLVQGDLPTVLIELGYLSNLADQQILMSSQGQQRLAEALYQGLHEFSNTQ